MKRVLFVDDEAPLLDGLRARLHALRHRWELVFVESGARAITEIEHRSVDVIVTDMRMPGMDGAQLLDLVALRWPETIRIVLSGYAEEEQPVAQPTGSYVDLLNQGDPILGHAESSAPVKFSTADPAGGRSRL